MSGVMRLSEVTRGYPEPTRAQMPQNGEKLVFSSSRLNKIFILFNLVYRLKALLPAGIDGTMVADKREQVKIEQNNCYCSIRAVNVVYGAGAARLPVA